MAFQCAYEHSDEGSENGDGKDGSEIPVGVERVKIALPLLCFMKMTWFCVSSRK